MMLRTATRVAAVLAASSFAYGPPPARAQGGERAVARGAWSPGLQWGPCPAFMPPGCGIAVLHGDPGKHNADLFFRLPGNSKAERHWHSSAERMVLVSGELQVDYDGQEPIVMRTGTYAYGPARVPHSASCRSAEPCVLFIAFEQPVDAVADAPPVAGAPREGPHGVQRRPAAPPGSGHTAAR